MSKTKTLHLGQTLRYPITINRLLTKPRTEIAKREVLLEYKYLFKRTRPAEKTVTGKDEDIVETMIAQWESPVDGKVIKWHVHEGETIHSDVELITVEEPCTHDVQWGKLCGICGKDMSETDWTQEQPESERAKINLMHDMKDDSSITVSAEQAARIGHANQRRLLKERRLTLVVDLDQTIIHTCVEKTIAEWKADPTNPNYDAVKDIEPFQLVADDNPDIWYYVKTRPGLRDFLKALSEKYEMHIYTMGTRQYALAVAKIVDPNGEFFKDRVISRDENMMTWKNLQRLFPSGTEMVVIIDDRSDVWPKNRTNLIKVSPYDFYKGIGDINSSFLPKRQDVVEQPVANGIVGGAAAPPKGEDEVEAEAPDPALQRQLVEEQERELEKQITEQTLRHMQEQLDREDEQKTDDAVSVTSERQHVLHDDDDELVYVQQHLHRLHEQFYSTYDRLRAEEERKAKKKNGAIPSAVSLLAVPDVGWILDELKGTVFQGLNIALSGLIPLGQDPYMSDVGLLVLSFGADLQTRVSRRVTHLVVQTERPGSHKLREASKFPSIKIVNHHWLFDCIGRWERLDETPYLFSIEGRMSRSAEATDVEMGAGIVGDEAVAAPTLMLVDEEGQPQELDEEDTNEDGERLVIDTEHVMPHEIEAGAQSPIDGLKDFNWEAVDEELAEFMGSDDDEEEEGEEGGLEDKEEDEVDAEEMAENEDLPPPTPSSGTKRKADEEGDGTLSPTKKARTNGNSPLRSVMTPDEVAEDGTRETGNEVAVRAMDDLEADMMAAFEAAE
jgi:RNA polymerase II subunit A C-terminal domain phosphatase